MEEKKKIGIMGGTFNPIHFGHLILAETAYHQFDLDQVLIMPTKNTYYKRMNHLVSEEDRTRMVQLAIEGNDHFRLSLEEINREGTTYTVETLRNLTAVHKNVEYYFIMGADSLYHMETWKDVEEILSMAVIVVAGRGSEGSGSSLNSQIEYMENKYDACILKLSSPVMEISSNDIRRRIREGESIRYLLPDSVRNYILDHGIYRTEDKNA